MQRIGGMNVKQITKLRTVNEIELTKAMYGIYNQEPIIGALRDIVGMAIENLVGWDNPKHGEKVRAAFVAEKNLDVWKGEPKTGDGLHNVWKRHKTWTASECADLLRLFGTVIETTDIGEGEGKAEHAAARVGGDARFKNIPAGPGRSRTGVPTAEKPAPANYQAPAAHVAAGRDMIKAVKMGGPGSFYGIGLYKLMPESTVRKIDTAFGLPEGADISGTTADSIFGMGRVLKFAEGIGVTMTSANTPVGVLKLLPLVSMIAQGHHTLVESALVLTLNKIIDYSIGFYTTLLPKVQGGGEELVGLLQPLVAKAENHMNNIPMVAFYVEKDKTYQGYMFDKKNDTEMAKFKTMATVGEDFLTTFRNNVTSMVTEKEIGTLMEKAGLSPR